MKWLLLLLLTACTTDEITIKIVKHPLQNVDKVDTYLAQEKEMDKKKCPEGCKSPTRCNDKTGKCESIANASTSIKDGQSAVYVNIDYGGENRSSPEDY